MKQLFVDDCPACEPINRLIRDLKKHKFRLVEQRLEDYHFHQLYFKLKGDIALIAGISFNGFTKNEHKFICDCHWSTVEIIGIST
jgi:hypothetical protein